MTSKCSYEIETPSDIEREEKELKTIQDEAQEIPIQNPKQLKGGAIKMTEKNYKDIDTELEFWKPEQENDFIAGILKNIKRNFGKNKANVYILKTDEGKLLSVWGCKVLDDKMSLVEIGDDIKIIYLGEKSGEEGKRKYHDYKIQRAEAEESDDADFESDSSKDQENTEGGE